MLWHNINREISPIDIYDLTKKKKVYLYISLLCRAEETAGNERIYFNIHATYPFRDIYTSNTILLLFFFFSTFRLCEKC